MKNIDIEAKKNPSPQQKLKDISKRVWYYKSIQWFHWGWMICRIRQGRRSFQSTTRCNSSQNIDCNLKTPPLYSTKIQKLKLSEFGYFIFLCFLLRRKSMRGKVHALVVIKSKLSWVIQIRQTVLGKEST